jgi:hypothetical protein
MRVLCLLLLLLLPCLAPSVVAVPPMLQLDVARFRNDDGDVKGSVVELYATVSGNSLRYMRRAPKMYQAAAVLTLEVIRPDGQAVYQETITLKPPYSATPAELSKIRSASRSDACCPMASTRCAASCATNITPASKASWSSP